MQTALLDTMHLILFLKPSLTIAEHMGKVCIPLGLASHGCKTFRSIEVRKFNKLEDLQGEMMMCKKIVATLLHIQEDQRAQSKRI